MDKRYFLFITYQGSNYHGWQRQRDVPTVQGAIEEALARLRLPYLLSGSSRTDKGVHAQGQVAHIDLPDSVVPSELLTRLNKLLAPAIYIHGIKAVASTAHARFDAIGRSYTYHVMTLPNPFVTGTSYYVPYPLDVQTMNEAATHLLGVHNCKSFCKGHADVPFHECNIELASWHVKGSQLTFLIRANRFVHGMVRAIVGTLIEVGRGRLSCDDFVHIILAQDRCAAKSAAPPQGLFLTKVHYPKGICELL